MVPEDSEGRRWAYGCVRSASTRLQAGHTTLSQRRFSASIEIATKGASAIYSALKADMKSSPDKLVSVDIGLRDDSAVIDISSDDLSHLRAGLNSYLRLVKAASSCLDVTSS